MTLLRAMSPEFTSNAAIIKEFHQLNQVKVTGEGETLIGKVMADDVIDPVDGEIYADAGATITELQARKISNSDLKGKSIPVITDTTDPLVLNSLGEEWH